MDRVPFALSVWSDRGTEDGKPVVQRRKAPKVRENDNDKTRKLFPMRIQMYAYQRQSVKRQYLNQKHLGELCIVRQRLNRYNCFRQRDERERNVHIPGTEK